MKGEKTLFKENISAFSVLGKSRSISVWQIHLVTIFQNISESYVCNIFIDIMKIQIWSYLCKNVTNLEKTRYPNTFVLNHDKQLLYLFLLTWKTNKFIKHKTIILKIDFALSFTYYKLSRGLRSQWHSTRLSTIKKNTFFFNINYSVVFCVCFFFEHHVSCHNH